MMNFNQRATVLLPNTVSLYAGQANNLLINCLLRNHLRYFMRIVYCLTVLLSFLLVACSPSSLQPRAGLLLDVTSAAFYPNAILTRLTTSHDSLSYQPGNYQLTIYRITYRTTDKTGNTIVASGVVYVPSQPTTPAEAYPLLSFQHPTAFSSADIPSETNFAVASFSYPLYFATHGYIVACPDYIGYGQSGQVAHPYEHAQTLAQATVDMLLATRELLTGQRVPFTKQVFLAGYSEGGYATLSAQKLIEDRYPSEIQLTGSSCGAGPYAMTDFFEYITQQRTAGGLGNYLYVWQTLSYNQLYAINKPVSYYFKAPYADQIARSMESARSMNASFNDLCTDEFRADVQNPGSPFAKALADDDLLDWTPQTATRLIHGEIDEIIPFLTTEQAYKSMRGRGSSAVSIVPIRAGYHVPTEVIFMRRSLEWFEQLRR